MNIYVGNLPYSASESDLEKIFGSYGEVSSARIIREKHTGKSRGFGFVTMENAAEAQEAIAALNGKEMKGRNLIVNEAMPKPGERRDRRQGQNRQIKKRFSFR